MRRFPKSKFQLLDPSSSKTTIDQQSDQSILVRENVYKHFEFFGIHGTQLNSRNSRLEFVPRVSKREHIQR